MGMRIRFLLFAILIAMVAVPAYAATYDATGRWTIWTDPGQTLTGPGFSIDVPEAWLMATITQHGGVNGNTFSMETDKIPELGYIFYSGDGAVEGSEYTFESVLTAEVNLKDLPGYEGFPFDVKFDISLAGFQLDSENELSGMFDIAGVGELTFSGEREVVPLPAAVWLLGSGIVALFGIRKRSRA